MSLRILHFMNSPLGIDQFSSGGEGIKSTGGWSATLIKKMLEATDYSFACAAFGKVDRIEKTSIDRLDCYVIPQGKNVNKDGLNSCREVVDEWKPVLVHIHGTEGPYGLLSARTMIKCPTVISLQGILGPCSEWYRFFGNRSLLDIYKMHWILEIALMRGLWKDFLQIRKNAVREREIISGNHYFMGRTAWDRAYARSINPSSLYYHEGRLLREAFWHKTWNMKNIIRHRIIFTNARHPRKGTETLLEAIRILKVDYPGICLFLAGEIPTRTGYGRYLRRLFNKFRTDVVELGPLNAEQLSNELVKSHVFAHSTFIDNSPNSVAEAQLLGMPVISTYTGGVPSLMDDGHTGLFVPTGDAPMLAERIRQIFEDDALAVKLGKQAQITARLRHDPGIIVPEILSTYDDILRKIPSQNELHK